MARARPQPAAAARSLSTWPRRPFVSVGPTRADKAAAETLNSVVDESPAESMQAGQSALLGAFGFCIQNVEKGHFWPDSV
eukprot:COSAG06_NODE_2553_length_6682_cov_137.987999_1_plen_80_part_00